jgi:D-glycero-D-manno-heptose 1,7-bisphosphate phosphatase
MKETAAPSVPAPPFHAIFLDRDGVINEEDGIIRSMDQLRLLPGVGEAIARLNEAGLPVIVITNQPVVARGWCTEAELGVIHEHLRDLLRPYGATLDAIYYCPHHENANDPAYRLVCECRKPRPGLLKRAGGDFGLDLSRCVLIGDRTVDLEAARAAGAAAWLVRTGYGGEDGKCGTAPDLTFADLTEAVEAILERQPRD